MDDWREAGLPKESWTRIDRIVKVNEWNMDCKIGELSQHDFIKVTQLVKEILTNKIFTKTESKNLLSDFFSFMHL